MPAFHSPSRLVPRVAVLVCLALVLSSASPSAPALASITAETPAARPEASAPMPLELLDAPASAPEVSLAFDASLALAGLPALGAAPAGFSRDAAQIGAAGRVLRAAARRPTPKSSAHWARRWAAGAFGTVWNVLRRRRRPNALGDARRAAAFRRDGSGALPRGAVLRGVYDVGAERGGEDAGTDAPSASAARPPASPERAPALEPARGRPVPRLRLSRLAARAVPSPVREQWRTLRGDVAWVRSFWRDVFSYGIPVKAELAKASKLGLAVALLSFLRPFLWGQMLQNFMRLKQAAPDPLSWADAAGSPALWAALGLGGLSILLSCLRAAADYRYPYLLYDISNKTQEGLVNFLARHSISLPLSYHHGSGKSDLVSLTTQSLFQVQEGATNAVVKTAKFGLMAGLSLGAMVWISPMMTAFVGPALVLTLALPTVRYGQRINAAYAAYFGEHQPRLVRFLTRMMQDIHIIKASGKEDDMLEEQRALSRQFHRRGGEEIAKAAVPHYVLTVSLPDLAEVLVAMTIFGFALFHGLPVWLATAYLFLACGVFSPAVNTLAGVFFSLRSISGAAARFDVLRRENPEDDGRGAPAPSAEGGWTVELQGVKFRYVPNGPAVLDGLDMTLPAGSFTALVGRSGTGKSSVIHALLRLFPFEGRIAVNGQDVGTLARRDLRRSIGLVLQGATPFLGTILSNLRWQRPDASEEAVWAAAELVGLHREVVRFGYERGLRPLPGRTARQREENALIARVRAAVPKAREHLRRHLRERGREGPRDEAPDDGLSVFANVAGGSDARLDEVIEALEGADPGLHRDITRLGYARDIPSDGTGLSGGQAQRLLLARLFVDPANPYRLIILDEPTSALDAPSQARVMRALRALRGRSTILMITHRFATNRWADTVYVLDREKIAQQGSHRDLLADEGGLYAQMARDQKSEAQAKAPRGGRAGGGKARGGGGRGNGRARVRRAR
ncbi:MAG: ATP-binding cassette domain-containing protein [Elusimicrobia bacterium]|nr:ATP-binding cassette domain-containing protein [Elusimicrobiota bacterium]